MLCILLMVVLLAGCQLRLKGDPVDITVFYEDGTESTFEQVIVVSIDNQLFIQEADGDIITTPKVAFIIYE